MVSTDQSAVQARAAVGDVAAGRGARAWDSAGGRRRLLWCGFWALLLAGLTLLLQARLLRGLDAAGLGLIVAARPAALAEVFNWAFRLGFAWVDAALALVWAGWLLARRRSLLAALPPLVLFLVMGLQGGLRLGVDQPLPGRAYELHRDYAAGPTSATLDRTDAAARQAFVASAAPLAAATAERGSFPSGHAARTLFLALVAGGWLGRLWLRGALLIIAGLVAYSALYFGYHWPSDVLGGVLLALAGYQLAAWIQGRATQRMRHGVKRL